MARRFQSGDSIVFPVPSALNGSDGGPLTILVVAKVNTSAYQAAIYTRSSGAHGWWFEYDTAGGLHANFGTGTTPRNVGTVSTGAWAIHTGRKDSGGSVHPFGRHLTGANFGTDSGDIDSGSTLVDGTAIDTSYGVQTGRWGNTGTDYSGDLEIAFIAVWTSLVAGATLAGLTTEALVLAQSPTYWISFESTGATDSASASPTITGTTTTSDPTGFFGSGQSAAVGTTAETDVAFTLGRQKSRAVGLTSETDTAFSLGRTKSKAIGTATSTEVAQTLGRLKTRTIGLTAEADEAFTIVPGGFVRAVGTTVETDAAFTLGRAKRKAIGTAVEVDQARPITEGADVVKATSTDTVLDYNSSADTVTARNSSADAVTARNSSSGGVT